MGWSPQRLELLVAMGSSSAVAGPVLSKDRPEVAVTGISIRSVTSFWAVSTNRSA